MDVSNEILDELRKIFELPPDSAIREDFLRLYKTYRKRKDICGIGDVTSHELVLLATLYDFVKKDSINAEVETVGSDTVIIEAIAGERSGNELKIGDKVTLMLKGSKELGTFEGYIDNTEMCKVKVIGDKMNYRKVNISNVKLYEEGK